MQAARADAKPWHQDAIDRITPVLKELASNTEAVINHLNATPKQLKFLPIRRILRPTQSSPPIFRRWSEMR